MRKLLDAKGQGPQVAEARAELVEAWERELNALVYELYGLTEGEIGSGREPLINLIRELFGKEVANCENGDACVPA